MRLYDRDYCELTEEEVSESEEIKEREIIDHGDGFLTRKNLFLEYPKAARHYQSLFPNNYLDIKELGQIEKLKAKNQDFLDLLNSDPIERDILNFIIENQAYHIIGSILKSNFNFGHHEAFLIPEFMLGTKYRADYLLFGRRTGGYEFAFIELEKPIGNITLQDGGKGEVIRKGIRQVNEWETWLEANYSNLLEVFDKYKKDDKDLPREFYELDKTRIHFVVVAGRRDDFNDKTYRIKRRLKVESKITLLHYDNLYDSAESIIEERTY